MNSPIVVDKAITIKGAENFGTEFQVSGSTMAFKLSAAATLDGIYINKTDNVNAHLVEITANGATVRNSKFIGKYVLNDAEVTRAIVPNAGNPNDAGVKGFTLDNNHIEALRQPSYLVGDCVGTITNNFVKGTRGWVVCVNSTITFTENRFEGNVVDIAIIANGQTSSENYTDVVTISNANTGAYVENQLIQEAAKNGVKCEMATKPPTPPVEP